MKYVLVGLCILFQMSCTNAKQDYVVSMLENWKNKEIVFPANLVFVTQRKDTVPFISQSKYTILTYVDSTGCIGCKLLLPKWNEMISFVDSAANAKAQFLFFFSPEKESDVYRALKIANFNHPICIDMCDSLNKLNHFPSDMAFQTFLLDDKNRVIAIGNPIHNPKVKELYLNILQGKTVINEDSTSLTKIKIKEQAISLGRFNWQAEQKAQFVIYNIGNKPLVINDVTTTCGCTSVDYSKQPIRYGDSLLLQVTYKADHPEHFDKTITVYCNTMPSLIPLKITGDAE